jgi:chromosome segregation ATPase
MILGLGFLAATLIALVILPAVNARAERLARRRVEAQFPLSISELTAEKDHLRAEFAVLQRRIERKAEEALAEKHQDMEELGRRALRIQALETELAARGERIGGLEGELAETQRRLAETDKALAETARTLAQTRDTTAAVEAAHRQILDELAATRARLDRAETALAETRTELAAANERLADREAAFARLEQVQAATLSEVDARRIAISDLETRLATQTARGDEFERLANDRRAELAAERQRLSDLARSLVSEQERAIAIEERARVLEAEREAWVAERRVASERLEAANAPGEALQRELASVREERSRLESELKAARRKAEQETAAIRSENAELRRRIDEVAEDILRFAEAGQARPAAAPPAA